MVDTIDGWTIQKKGLMYSEFVHEEDYAKLEATLKQAHSNIASGTREREALEREVKRLRDALAVTEITEDDMREAYKIRNISTAFVGIHYVYKEINSIVQMRVKQLLEQPDRCSGCVTKCEECAK